MPKRRMLANSLIFSGTTMLSRVLGLLRDVVVASSFGVSIMTDAFYVAFRFANLFRAFFAEGAFSQAFIPNLAKVAQKEPQHERLFIGNMMILLGLVLITLVAVIELNIEIVAKYYAFGYSNDQQQLAIVIQLLQVSLPYIVLISLSALVCAVLQSHQHFFISGFSPVVLNLCMIFACLFATDLFELPIAALAWAALIAGVLQLLLPAIQMVVIGKHPVFSLRRWHPAVKKTIIIFGPIVIAASATQIAMLIDTILATFLQTGSVTWLYIANRLIGFPLGVFGISISLVVLPALSRALASEDTTQSHKIFGWGANFIFVIGAPAACGLIISADAIVATLFEYDRFLPDDTKNAANAVRLYSTGLLGMMFLKIILNTFLAAGDSKTPLKIAFIATIINITLSLILMQWIGFMGLALSTALASICHSLILYLMAVRRGQPTPGKKAIMQILRIVAACLVMVIACWLMLTLVLPPTSEWGNWNVISRAGMLISILIVAAASYSGILLVSGFPFKKLLSP